MHGNDTMIDEHYTWKIFGYVSDDLSTGSHKRIVAVCDGCGLYRDVEYRAYSDLCFLCTRRSVETRKKNSESKMGENAPNYGKFGEDHPRYGKHHSDETKKKISEAISGKNHYFYGKHHSDETKKKISKSRECYVGENSPNWKGGITSWRLNMLSSKTYKNWRTSVFVRDDYTCRMCETRGGKLEAHHIMPIRDNKNTLLIYDTNNGITLCRDCHDETKYKEIYYVDMFQKMINNAGEST